MSPIKDETETNMGGKMNTKTRRKLQKHFGFGFVFNTKIKIPLSSVVIASYVMGDMNSEKFWNSIIKDKLNQRKVKHDRKNKNIC